MAKKRTVHLTTSTSQSSKTFGKTGELITRIYNYSFIPSRYTGCFSDVYVVVSLKQDPETSSG
jgi:hypothetical protein